MDPATMSMGITTPNCTPQHDHIQNVPCITQLQKQALIDNVQLEIAERARRLRAQHALQAQSLRSRLEMRVNRIPQGLRKRKMQDMLAEHAERSKPAPSAPVAVAPPCVNETSTASPEPRVRTRTSEEVAGQTNGDGLQDATADVANPKKRIKHAANTKVSRTASKNVTLQSVLSPRSANSRTLPKSPIKPNKTSPAKPQSTNLPHPATNVPRQTMPSSGTARSTARTTSRAQSRAAAQRPASKPALGKENVTLETAGQRSSDGSTTSAATTIVKKPASKVTATKKSVATAAAKAGTTAMAKRAAASRSKEKVAPAPAATTRTLRKRG